MNAARNSISGQAGSVAGRIWLLAVFVTVTMLLGGTSRYDSGRLILLLPLGCLFAALGSSIVDWRAIPRLPLLFVSGIVLLLMIQLVPLPFAIWSALPGREPVAALASAMGLEQAYPLSLAPYRTLNALAGTPLLFAALTIAAAQGDAAPRRVLAAVALLAIASATVGLLQIALPTQVFYLYERTNIGSPVGLFANSNHAALCNVLGILALAGLLAIRPQDRAMRWLAPVGIAGLTLVNLVNGSRAGFMATAIAITASSVALFLAARTLPQSGRFARRPGQLAVIALGCLAAIWLAGAAAVLSGRVPAMDQLLTHSPLDDIRFALMPTLLTMAQTYWPIGTGIGAFEDAFYIHEPTALVGPTYVNMAHNDFLQLVIEGGLPWLALFTAAASGAGLALVRLHRANRLPTGSLVLIAAAVAVLIVTSSVEYAMRDPIFEIIAIMALAATCRAARAAKPALSQNHPGAPPPAKLEGNP
ncbi:O-antigen ligase family protein [Croceicoccus bisphenolivorans]|uniref:O-antigen ligase family protein n=1 Tax=Croceicoccus bisphenolivorans TaxID=1783232 RepID=UPI000836FAB4|nr:O-antigen ligase family protein [Croceicoccus bisphenolivorans]